MGIWGEAPVTDGEQGMRESCGEAVATRAGPEPWRRVRKGATQASVGVRVGWVLSRVSSQRPGRRGRSPEPKAIPAVALARVTAGPRAVVDPMHARRLSVQELGGPAAGRGADLPAFSKQAGGPAVRAVNPTGARRR